MPSGLGSIERDLPLFGRQVPTGSIALIGYTVGSYSSKANPTDVSLSMNVLWVAVLAASEDTWQVYYYLCFTSLLIVAFQIVLLFSVSFMMTRCSEWWRLWSRFWCSLSFTLLCIQPPYGIYIVFNYQPLRFTTALYVSVLNCRYHLHICIDFPVFWWRLTK